MHFSQQKQVYINFLWKLNNNKKYWIEKLIFSHTHNVRLSSASFNSVANWRLSKLSFSFSLWFHANNTAIWNVVTSMSNFPISLLNVIYKQTWYLYFQQFIKMILWRGLNIAGTCFIQPYHVDTRGLNTTGTSFIQLYYVQIEEESQFQKILININFFLNRQPQCLAVKFHEGEAQNICLLFLWPAGHFGMYLIKMSRGDKLSEEMTESKVV